jgi:hypothetical protein
MLTPKEACLSSIGENPPAEKIERSDKSNRANSADRRPNSTRKFKTFAPSLPPYSLLVIYPPLGTTQLHLWYSCAESFLVTSSQLGQTSFGCSWISSSRRIPFARLRFVPSYLG